MSMQQQFDDGQLEQVIDQAVIYQCACPAQVARLLLTLREVRDYQESCLAREDTALQATHARIIKAVEAAHTLLEQCFNDVLELEHWDKSSLTMPTALRQLAHDELGRWQQKPE